MSEIDGITVESEKSKMSEDGIPTEDDGIPTKDDGVSTEDDGISTEKYGIPTEDDGISTEKDGMSTEEDGMSTEEDGMSTEKRESVISDNKPIFSNRIYYPVDASRYKYKIAPSASLVSKNYPIWYYSNWVPGPGTYSPARTWMRRDHGHGTTFGIRTRIIPLSPLD